MGNSLKNLFPGVSTVTQCGGFGCKNYIAVSEGRLKPEVLICAKCQERINQGIVEWVHANTGKIRGSYHIIDGAGE